MLASFERFFQAVIELSGYPGIVPRVDWPPILKEQAVFQRLRCQPQVLHERREWIVFHTVNQSPTQIHELPLWLLPSLLRWRLGTPGGG